MGQALYLTGTVPQSFHYEWKFSDLGGVINSESKSSPDLCVNCFR